MTRSTLLGGFPKRRVIGTNMTLEKCVEFRSGVALLIVRSAQLPAAHAAGEMVDAVFDCKNNAPFAHEISGRNRDSTDLNYKRFLTISHSKEGVNA